MTNLLQDIRHGLRILLKSPGFTAAAVIVLGLGIGANSAIFSVVNAVLLRPLPFQDSARLVQVWHVPPARSFPGMTQFSVSAANFVDWQAQNHAFEQMAIYSFSHLNLTGRDQPESLQGSAVSPDFFSTLRKQPMLGRPFTLEENQPGQDHVVILSYNLWKNRFGADTSIIGHQVSFDGQPYTVVGVMDSKFLFPSWAQFWVPLAWTDQQRAVRGEHHYLVVGRLKPNIELAQAQSEMDTISSRLEQQYPEDDKGWGAVIVPLREQTVKEVRPALLILLGAVAFVLLIACANVANLLLAKTLGRRKELAIRAALGASRARVFQQLLAETLILSLAGGALGIFLAKFGIALTVNFLSSNLPKSTEISLDGWVLVFTLGLSLVTGIIAGVAPAMRLSKSDLNDALKQGGRTDSDSSNRSTRSLLVISEVALSLVLLIGAGLLIRSLWSLSNVDPGFDPHNVLTMTVVTPRHKFAHPVDQISFFNRALDQVRALPGVQSAGVIDNLPIDGGGSHQPVSIEGHPILAMADQPEIDTRLISPGYFPSMRIPLLRGREFNDSDSPDTHGVVIISQAMANRFWPNEDPLGKHLTMTFYPDKSREVIGVVADVKLDSLDALASPSTVYMPLSQLSAPALGGWSSFPLIVVVRTASPPYSLVSSTASAIHSIDKDQPITDVMSMDDFISRSLSQQRFNVLLLGAFAVLALLLAAVGIYSVLAYSVRKRVREISIRVALGAQISDVLRLVVIEGMKPTLFGIAIGLAVSLAVGPLLASLIYGVTPTDPLTFAAVSVILITVALLACIIPAFRATRVEPLKALREE